MMTKKNKQPIFKLLVISLIALTILLLVGFFFFLKGKEKENQTGRISDGPNAKKQVQISYYPTKIIKIQKTTSGKYFVNFSYNKDKKDKNSQRFSFTEGKNCFSAEEMPKILNDYQECGENNDGTGGEKELKDNYLLVKERKQEKDGSIQRQTGYEFLPISEANREEKEAEEIRKNAEQIKKECEERARKGKEEHKNEGRICRKRGKKFCLEIEGSITTSSSSKNGGKSVEKTEYFCDECR